MTKSKNGPSSSDGQEKNENEKLYEKIRNWENPNDPPEDLTQKLDQLSAQIWDRRGLPLPIADFFDNLYQTYQESLDRTGLAEWCFQYGIPWTLYVDLRGHLFAKHDPNKKEGV